MLNQKIIDLLHKFGGHLKWMNCTIKDKLKGRIKVETSEIRKIFTEYVTNRQIKELKQEIKDLEKRFKRFDEIDIAIIDAQGEDW